MKMTLSSSKITLVLALLVLIISKCEAKRGDMEDTEEFDVDENFEEMTFDNISGGQAGNNTSDEDPNSTRVMKSVLFNEEELEEEIANAENSPGISTWKIVLIIVGSVFGVVLLISLVILALKNALQGSPRRNVEEAKESVEDEEGNTAEERNERVKVSFTKEFKEKDNEDKLS